MLQQLPPKRRQVIRLSLKRSDIVAAKTAVGVLKIDASENASEDMPLETLDESDGIVHESLHLLYLSGGFVFQLMTYIIAFCSSLCWASQIWTKLLFF